jgi:SEC-C motif-containing protein
VPNDVLLWRNHLRHSRKRAATVSFKLSVVRSFFEYLKAAGVVALKRLMRARYSAYTTGAIDFLEKSTHSKTRKQLDPVAAERWSRDSCWLGLTILGVDSALYNRAHVNFEARYEDKDDVSVFHRERSLFEREGDEWRFVSGGAIPAVSQKIGLNETCPCGSGKGAQEVLRQVIYFRNCPRLRVSTALSIY